MVKTRHLFILFVPLIVILGVGIVASLSRFSVQKRGEKPEQKTAPSIIPIFADDPVFGDKKSPNTLILFADFACEACREEDQTLVAMLERYPKSAKIVWKGLSVVSFPVSSKESLRYGVCSNRQGEFAAFKGLTFERQKNLSRTVLKEIQGLLDVNQKKFDECLSDPSVDKTLSQNEQLAEALGIQEVPTMFLNGKQTASPTSLEAWAELLNLKK